MILCGCMTEVDGIRDCHWKSGRRGEIGEGDRDAEESEDGAVSDG